MTRALRGRPARPPPRRDMVCDVTTRVTGAFGCIGSWVVRALLADGERPVAVDVGDDPWRLTMIAGDDVLERITLVRGDIVDREAVTRAVQEHGVQRIIHLAAWQ